MAVLPRGEEPLCHLAVANVPRRHGVRIEPVVEDQLVEQVFAPESLEKREVACCDPAVAGEELRRRGQRPVVLELEGPRRERPLDEAVELVV